MAIIINCKCNIIVNKKCYFFNLITEKIDLNN